MERSKIVGFVGPHSVDVDGTPHREVTFYAVDSGQASILVTEDTLSVAGVRLASETDTLISATVTIDATDPIELNPTDFENPRELPGHGAAPYFRTTRDIHNAGNA